MEITNVKSIKLFQTKQLDPIPVFPFFESQEKNFNVGMMTIKS